ncbi:Thaumatin-like protein, partial [Cucurbita argyrosperma subsp. argyrosperma]
MDKSLYSESESESGGEQLILANNCNESVWPGILGNSGHQTPMGGGFHLGRGKHTKCIFKQQYHQNYTTMTNYVPIVTIWHCLNNVSLELDENPEFPDMPSKT